MSAIAVVACAAGGVENLREGLVEPLINAGHQVAVTLTPTAAEWLKAIGEVKQLEDLTNLPVRSVPRLPSEKSPHPKIDAFVGAPMTANSVAKLALGIADNQAMTMLRENIGTDAPMVIFPRTNAAHARQPAWLNHLNALRMSGVQVLYGESIWPLYEPRKTGQRQLPWADIISAIRYHPGP